MIVLLNFYEEIAQLMVWSILVNFFAQALLTFSEHPPRLTSPWQLEAPVLPNSPARCPTYYQYNCSYLFVSVVYYEDVMVRGGLEEQRGWGVKLFPMAYEHCEGD